MKNLCHTIKKKINKIENNLFEKIYHDSQCQLSKFDNEINIVIIWISNQYTNNMQWDFS